MGWFAFDVDGTIAEYHGWVPDGSIGKPITAMIRRIKNYIKKGRDVRLCTARINPSGRQEFPEQFEAQKGIIDSWCLEHIGQTLPICYEKDLHMVFLFDDRAMQVIPNTGILIQEELRRAVTALHKIANNLGREDGRDTNTLGTAIKRAQETLDSLTPWSRTLGL